MNTPPRTIRRALALLACSAAPLSNAALAQCTSLELERIRPQDEVLDNRMGHAVAMSGDIAVISAYLDDDNGQHSGSVYVYEHDGCGWLQQQKLVAPDGQPFDWFGFAVATDGELIAVGAPGDDDKGSESGSLYVFRRVAGQYVFESKCTASDGVASDEFGWSVAVSGDAVLSGSIFDSETGPETGATYAYRWDGTNWSEEQKLTASDKKALDLFGFFVSMSGDTALIGACQDSGDGPGQAYVFRYDGTQWVEEQQLVPSDTAQGDQFGWSTAIRGDLAFVGAVGKDNSAGAAYVYRFDGSQWNEEQKLVASDRAGNDQFGVSVAINDEYALVGAFGETVPGSLSGAAYAYQFDGTTWGGEHKLEASDAQNFALFGVALTMDGNRAIIGNEPVFKFGTAYAFELGTLILHVTPEEPGPIDTLGFTTCGGRPGRRAALAAVEIDGIPVARRFATGVFDANGTWVHTQPVPPGLSGRTVKFRAFELKPGGAPELSNKFQTEFQ